MSAVFPKLHETGSSSTAVMPSLRKCSMTGADQCGVGAALWGRNFRMKCRETFHVCFVNYGVAERSAGRPIILPFEGRVDDDAFGNERGVGPRIASQVFESCADPIGEQGVVPSNRTFDRFRVRIDEEPRGVEPQAVGGIVWSRTRHAERCPGPIPGKYDCQMWSVRSVRLRTEPGTADSASSKGQTSTPVACSEKNAKLTPLPSQVAPKGNGWPGRSLPIGVASVITFPPPRIGDSATADVESTVFMRAGDEIQRVGLVNVMRTGGDFPPLRFPN